jgi:hypothetical protein
MRFFLEILQTLTCSRLYRLVLLPSCSCAFAVRRIAELLTNKLLLETFHSSLLCKTDPCLRFTNDPVNPTKFFSTTQVSRTPKARFTVKVPLNNIPAPSMAHMDFLVPLVPSLPTPLHHTPWVPLNPLTLMEPPSLVNLMLQTFLILPFNQASLMKMTKRFLICLTHYVYAPLFRS